jgi:hypothetical protein
LLSSVPLVQGTVHARLGIRVSSGGAKLPERASGLGGVHARTKLSYQTLTALLWCDDGVTFIAVFASL